MLNVPDGVIPSDVDFVKYEADTWKKVDGEWQLFEDEVDGRVFDLWSQDIVDVAQDDA